MTELKTFLGFNLCCVFGLVVLQKVEINFVGGGSIKEGLGLGGSTRVSEDLNFH